MLLQTAALLGVLLLGFGYFWLLVPSTEARLQQLGLFCSVFTISMYLSPLADLVSEGVQGGGGGERWEVGSRRERMGPKTRGHVCVLRKLRQHGSFAVSAIGLSHPLPQAKVIQTKSTQRLSFSLTIATLLTSASWTLYGFRLRDPYIMVSSTGKG